MFIHSPLCHYAYYNISFDDRLLREKQCRDEEFIEICKLRQGAALHTIDSLLDLPVSLYSLCFIFLIKGEEKWPVDQLLFRAIAHAKQPPHYLFFS